ncbi:MAG: hypothetical protein NT129_01710 [Candidatus Aenigmarchaeota archaeon]|nr:hypothetical protein [Candidatus Aenigmarchaeota archaeon]
MEWNKFKSKKMIIFIILIVILILFFYPKPTKTTSKYSVNEWIDTDCDCFGIETSSLDSDYISYSCCFGILYYCHEVIYDYSPVLLDLKKIDIIGAKSGNISIMNIGTKGIYTTELSIYINGVIQTCNWNASSFVPGEIIKADCNCNFNDTIKVTSPANYDLDTCL